MKLQKILALLLAVCLLLCACAAPAEQTDTQPPTQGTTETRETEPAIITDPEDINALSWEEIFASDKSLTWVFAGDSITHCGNWSQGMNSYSEWFEQYLYDIDRRDDSVILTAWGGADIYDFQTVENTPGDNGTANNPGMGIEQFVTKYNPDVVFIKLGMNDRYKDNATFVQYYKQMLESIYELCRAQGKIPKIVLLSPSPVSGDSVYNMAEAENEADSSNTWRQRNLIEEIAQEYALTFVDLLTAFTSEALTLGEDYHHTFFSDPSDGALHPNAAGQYLIFTALAETLGIHDTSMTIFRHSYADCNDAALWIDATDGIDYSGDYGHESANSQWIYTVMENELWVVAGGDQMASYQGSTVYRSLFRLLDNAMRGGGNNNASYRDIRLASVAAPGRTLEELQENWDALVGKYDYQVFLLLPEIAEVYDQDYVHSADRVNAYAQTVRALLDKAEGKFIVLWTPLASSDETVNGYLSEYAEAVRQIVSQDVQAAGGTSDILFFDANKFMNESLSANPELASNWYEEGVHISPLCALDVATAFYTYTGSRGFTGTGSGELTAHNLRLTRDNRVFKGPYVRDYLDFVSGVDETGVVSVDVTAIREKYPEITDLRIAILPEVGAGDGNTSIWDDFRQIPEGENAVTFPVPYENTVLTLYGELNGLTYRFRDTTVTVAAGQVSDESRPYYATDSLLSLAIVGTPDFGFRANTAQYTVNLYQYQRNVQLLAEGGDNLAITVTDQDGNLWALTSGVPSGLIPVGEEDPTLTVSVTGEGVQEQIYTLRLIRPEYPDIIITEVMTDGYLKWEGEGNDNYELIEIYNASGRDLNLLDYSIGYKTDYSYASQEVTGGQWPYYFTGNDQAFQSTSSDSATYTSINTITKYSSYWVDKTEPARVNFPADSTMVIWVKFARGTSDVEGYSTRLTYDTLRAALEANGGTYTLQTMVDGTLTTVVPAQSQMVVAEIPVGQTTGVHTARANTLLDASASHFFMDGRKDTGIKTWLFVLADSAQAASNGAITEAGDDIISAGKFTQLTKNGDKLSTVFYYDTDRGMSVVPNEGTWNEDLNGQYVSSQQGYLNKTSFGAIEYWQKPYDTSDAGAPTVDNQTPATAASGSDTRIVLNMSDDQDIRYAQLHVKVGDGEWITVTRDLVLETSISNGGRASDVKSVSFTYDISGVTGDVLYYGYVLDGTNGGMTAFGSADAPLTITVQ